MSRTALIAGVTGLVGEQLLLQMVASDTYAQITLLSRKPLAVDDARVRVVMTDFSDLAALGTALRADDVFCCLGTTLKTAGSRAAFERVDYQMVVDLARAAHAQGAQQFLVISAAGTAANSPSFYSRVKARMEQDVAAAGFDSVQILRPSLLLGTRREHRQGERAAQRIMPMLSPLLWGGLKKYRAVTAHDVAAAMLQLAARRQSG
ncbi:MAG TPA: NAD(P)H-binding protein, partial [Stenotrophobium sp.]|nr:NAD(P)H-binding protein [Stenotrophobium sp.]